MTPAVLVHRIWSTRRGVGGLIVALALVGLLLYATWANMAAGRVVVQYGAEVIAPEDATLCPGDELRYDVHVTVGPDSLPSVAEIHEGWYSMARQVVLRSTITEMTVPLVRPTDLRTTATRIVPDIAPGEYWYDHVSHNGRVEAYTVGPVTVLEPIFCGE